MKKILIYFVALVILFGGFNLWRYVKHLPLKDDANSLSETEKSTENKNIPIAQATIEETIVADEAGVVITATHIEYEEHSAKLFLSVRNNSEKEISISSYDYSSINDVMFDANVWWIVKPSDEDDASVYISYDWLAMHGISEIAVFDIGFEFSFYDDSEDIYTTPTRIKTSAADKYERQENGFQKALEDESVQKKCGFTIDYFSANVLFEEQDICIVSQTLISEYKQKTLLLEINNNSKQGVRVRINDVHFNDLLVIDGCWTSLYVFPNQKGVLSINTDSILKYDHWSLFGIDELSHIDMQVEIVDIYGETIEENKAIRVQFKDILKTFETTRDIIYDENNVRIFKVGITEDTSIYPDVLVYLLVENSRNENITISDYFQKTIINGKECTRFSTDVDILAGQTALYEIELGSNFLEEIGITRESQIREIVQGMEISYESTLEEKEITITITQ